MTEADAAVLRAEVVALQAVMISLFRHMAAEHPELAVTFCRAFDHAEAIVTGVAVKMGLEAPRETTVGALQVIEELRAAVIRDESVCKPTD
jgi:triphosphoribosyl-dephospho-CoA synthetase